MAPSLSGRFFRAALFFLFCSALPALIAGCDAVELPADQLVVEFFPETGAALPRLTVRRTAALDAPAAPPVTDALVTLNVSGEDVAYEHVVSAPGYYRPRSARELEVGDEASLEVRWSGRRVTGASVIPEAIALDSVRLEPAAAPVAAVFADSLGLSLEEGFLYTVDVTLYWRVPASDTAWVRARLRPPADFPSVVVDFLLETEVIEAERAFTTDEAVRSWRGVYAVPVESATDALPSHELDVALVRSGEDYARYARSRTDPDRREPVGNVEGGLGVVAAVAVARQTLTIE